MAVEGKNPALLSARDSSLALDKQAERLGLEGDASQMINTVVEIMPDVLDAVGNRLPKDFPVTIYDAVCKGMLRLAKRLEREPDRRRG